MTIQRGQPWGRTAPLPPDAPIISTNSELRQTVSDQRSEAGTSQPIGVLGGDLWQVVGAPGGGLQRLRSDQAHTAQIDLISVRADGENLWACVSVLARTSWWYGPVVAVMNAEFAGRWRIAPAAHPNDGRLHVLEMGINGPPLRLRERFVARGRLRTGSHIPHPAISVRRVTDADFRFERPLQLWLDGERIGKCQQLSVRAVPDAAEIVF